MNHEEHEGHEEKNGFHYDFQIPFLKIKFVIFVAFVVKYFLAILAIIPSIN